MTLGDYIKEYRQSHKFSMDDFAKLSGLSKAYVSILERNYNPSTGKAAIPSLETIKRVANATGVDFNDLIEMLDRDQEILLSTNDHEDTPANDNKSSIPTHNIIRIAARDGTFTERVVTDDQLAALKAILDQMPEVPDGL